MLMIDCETLLKGVGDAKSPSAAKRLDPLTWLSRATTATGVRDIANPALAGEGPLTERVPGLGCADGLAGAGEADGDASAARDGDSLLGCDQVGREAADPDPSDSVAHLIRQASQGALATRTPTHRAVAMEPA